jgi:hypothetical protein
MAASIDAGTFASSGSTAASPCGGSPASASGAAPASAVQSEHTTSSV